MKIQVLDGAKKKKFLSGLAEFGMRKIPELLVRTGMERVRAFSGSLSREEIMEIWRMFPIEGVGLYVGKEFVNRNGTREVRMSVDGMHVWKEQLTEKIFVLREEQEKIWFEGKDVELSEGQLVGSWELGVGSSFVLVKSADGKDFVGMGKIGGEGKILFGYLPKERRRRVGTV